LPNFSTAAMDRHSFSAASRGDDGADLFEPTAFTARAGDLGRSAAVFGGSFAVRAAWHSLMVEHAGNCGRQRLRISRRNISDEVAPSMPRKLRVIHPSSSTRASSRVGVFSFSGIPSDVRSAKLPKIVAGIMHPPNRQRIIADSFAIRSVPISTRIMRRDRASKVHFNFRNGFDAVPTGEQRNSHQERKRHNKASAEADKARTM
jgi:hypothetical protein